MARPSRCECKPTLTINDPLLIFRLLLEGGGVDCVSGYLCGPEIAEGRLERLLLEWTLPSVEVNAVYASSHQLSPAVRAFVDYLKLKSGPDSAWMPTP
jgi:DNA-binding transcriptional LysR family regulator